MDIPSKYCWQHTKGRLVQLSHSKEIEVTKMLNTSLEAAVVSFNPDPVRPILHAVSNIGRDKGENDGIRFWIHFDTDTKLTFRIWIPGTGLLQTLLNDHESYIGRIESLLLILLMSSRQGSTSINDYGRRLSSKRDAFKSKRDAFKSSLNGNASTDGS
eukprot:g77239.t1